MSLVRTRAMFGTAAVVAMVAAAVWLATDSTTASGQPAMPKEDQLKPKWAIGDSWVLETTTQPVPARIGGKGADMKDAPAAVPVVAQWKFTVAAQEKLGAADCFRIEITVLPDPKNQPVTKIWIDAKSLAMRQFETQLPVAGELVTITESYDFGNGQPAPVSAPITAIPLDLPMFVGGRAGEQLFSYEAASGPVARKRDAGDVAFAVDVKQTMTPVKLDDKTRALVPPNFARDFAAQPLVEVKLTTSERSVTQIWQAGQPWPVYAQNGSTTAKLVSVAKK